MNESSRTVSLLATLTTACVTAALLSACLGTGGTKTESSAATPAAAAAPAVPKICPGMNARGEVVHVKKVESGYGQKLKGLGDREGEITGKPAPGTKFAQLQIGMSTKQVLGRAEPPSLAIHR